MRLTVKCIRMLYIIETFLSHPLGCAKRSRHADGRAIRPSIMQANGPGLSFGNRASLPIRGRRQKDRIFDLFDGLFDNFRRHPFECTRFSTRCRNNFARPPAAAHNINMPVPSSRKLFLLREVSNHRKPSVNEESLPRLLSYLISLEV